MNASFSYLTLVLIVAYASNECGFATDPDSNKLRSISCVVVIFNTLEGVDAHHCVYCHERNRIGALAYMNT